MRADCRKSLDHRVRATVAKSIIVLLALAFMDTSASAQNGIFDTILGGRRATPATPPPVSAYADPFSAWNPFGSPASLNSEMDRSVAYCVRLCDGRFFPIQRSSGATPDPGLQLVLPGHPDQDFLRQQHRSRGRERRRSATRPAHGLRLSRKACRRLHLQRQGRGRPRRPRGEDDPTLRAGRHRRQ